MKKKRIRMMVVLLVFAMLLVPVPGMESHAATPKSTAKASTKVKKPGQVKTLKKVNVKTYYDKKSERNVSTAKIKFSKVKGATGYQVLLYRTNRSADDLTPLVFALNTKNTTYTIKNMIPDFRYTIKVRAYTKGKDGKIVYGKTKSLKIKTDRKSVV